MRSRTSRTSPASPLGLLAWFGLVALLAPSGCGASSGTSPAVAIEVPRPTVALHAQPPPLQVAGDAIDSDDEVAHVGRGVTQEPCASESRRRSLESTTSLQLDYRNDRSRRVSLYWLDFQGKRVHYADLEPGEAYRQQTYVTHPWVAVDGDGRCRAIFVPRAAGIHEVAIGAS